MAQRTQQRRIMVFGTFDGLHRGHLHFFKQAKNLVKKNLKSFLIVSVARDVNVAAIKGALPHRGERERMNLIKKLIIKSKRADKVVLSGIKNYLPHILKEKPDIIALGYDQSAYVQNLKKDLKSKGILVKIVRLKPYKKEIYKNRLLRAKRRT